MKITKVLAIATLSLVATQAFAWGHREQGMLIGAGAVLLGQHIYQNHQPRYRPEPVYYVQPQPVYVAPPPPRVIVQPAYMDLCNYSGQVVRVYDSYGNVLGMRHCN
jgi:hypothetical protein